MGVQKFVAFSCPHVPLHDRDFISWMLGQVQDFQPDQLICLGDLFEADSASRWPSEYGWDLEDEYHETNALLYEIRQSIHGRKRTDKAKLVFLPGNHDDNILAMDRLPPKVRGLTDWRRRQYSAEGDWLNGELLSHWERPTIYSAHRDKGVYRIGPVSFFHGFECSQSSDEFQSYLYGMPYGLSVSGHTHRPVHVTQARRTKAIPLPYWYANVGCACQMDREYMQRKRQHDWGQAIILGETTTNYSVRGYNPSPQWDAEVKVFKGFYGA